MIFNNYLTEKEIVEKLIKESEYESGIILRIDYDNEENIGTLQEANIPAEELNAPQKRKEKSRYILISGSQTAKHPGRMKISKRGSSISRGTSHNNYIEVYKKNDNTITHDGNINNISMSSKELKFYYDLFSRNYNIIQMVKDGDNKYNEYIDNALVKDEQLRNSGKIVKRDTVGNVSVYDKNNNLLYKEDITGKKII